VDSPPLPGVFTGFAVGAYDEGQANRRVEMARPARQIESRALKLSPSERARLAERLISSLDDEAEADAEALWMREAERRLGELRRGHVKGRPATSVFRKARSMLR